MKPIHTILATLILASATACATADLTPSTLPAAPARVTLLASEPCTAASLSSAASSASLTGDCLSNPLDLAQGGGLPSWERIRLAGDAPSGAGSEPAIRQLPGAPGSAGLVLSALLTVGAWQFTRKAAHLHLGQVPDWYHAHAPVQIGHCVAFDPAAGFDWMPVCLFDRPLGDRPVLIFRARPESDARCLSVCFLPVIAPRGPPAVS